MIQFLEEEIECEYDELKEAIKFHHTEIAEYVLINNAINDTTIHKLIIMFLYQLILCQLTFFTFMNRCANMIT